MSGISRAELADILEDLAVQIDAEIVYWGTGNAHTEQNALVSVQDAIKKTARKVRES